MCGCRIMPSQRWLVWVYAEAPTAMVRLAAVVVTLIGNRPAEASEDSRALVRLREQPLECAVVKVADVVGNVEL